MAASGKTDATVRSSSSHRSLQERPRLGDRSLPRCQSYCCSPVRPQLSRSAASHHSASSAKSLYSTGTDGSHAQSEPVLKGLDLPADDLDITTFEQILEMDDDEEERDFSKSIVYDFFTQADGTFQKMKSNLEKKDLGQLSSLGHFLKGSSATLGLSKVKDSCEKIQHLGAKKDETGTHDETDEDLILKKLDTVIKQAESEFKVCEKALRKFYEQQS